MLPVPGRPPGEIARPAGMRAVEGMLRPAAAYERLREEMEYDRAPFSYSYIRNDPLYPPHGQGDNTTPPTWFTTQIPIPVDYTVY